MRMYATLIRGCKNGNDEPPYFHPVQQQCPRFWTLAMSTRRSCHLLLVGLPATISASRSRVAWAIACHGNSQWVHLGHLDPSSHLSSVNCQLLQLTHWNSWVPHHPRRFSPLLPYLWALLWAMSIPPHPICRQANRGQHAALPWRGSEKNEGAQCWLDAQYETLMQTFCLCLNHGPYSWVFNHLHVVCNHQSNISRLLKQPIYQDYTKAYNKTPF